MSNEIGELIWLASYPKSGNTWIRLFLHALKTGKPIDDLNNINSADGIGSSRQKINYYLGIDSSELPDLEVQKLRFEVYKLLLNNLEKQVIMKTHDTPFHKNIRIIPNEGKTKVILIVRNPFDVTLSYSKHMGITIPKAVKALCNEKNTIAKGKNYLNSQVSQELGTWSNYINNWKIGFKDKITFVRYEDLINDPFNTFSKLLIALDWSYSDESIKTAIDNSSFNKLQLLEKKSGFLEKPKQLKSFFRKGKVGVGINQLSSYHKNKLIKCNFDNLLFFKYIDKEGNILIKP